MGRPILSVIIPVYNTEAYLERCLDSVIHQSLNSIELLIINDCSEGNTDIVVEKYMIDPRVHYFKFETNKGLSAVRNFGLGKAVGEYIIFCDSDDWVDIFLYENMYKSLERTKADIAICGTKKEFPLRDETIIKANFEKEIKLNSDTAFKIMTFQYPFGITITPSATNKMVRKSLLEKYSIRFLESVYYEDLLYSFQIMLYSQNVVCIPDYYYHYFRRENSTVISISKYHIKSFYLIFSEIKKFLIDKDLFDIYKFNYYKFGERFYNLIIRQIFEFEKDEAKKKELMEYSITFIKQLITISEFIEYSTAEKLRKHIQPYITDTKIV
jgi:glycosyltransferase involved in cell wall biosynthesis